jgi:adenylate kinase family enzyme
VLGKRIVVYGTTGSGKTTLSRRLGAVLGLSVIELDALHWEANWTSTPADEFLAKVEAALAASPEGWVVDGNYSEVRPYILSQADTVVWLRLPWRVSYWRMLRRTLARAFSGEELWNGNKESWRLSFTSRDSLLWWGIHHHRASIRNTRAAVYGTPHNARVIELRSPGEVEALLREVEAAGAS